MMVIWKVVRGFDHHAGGCLGFQGMYMTFSRGLVEKEIFSEPTNTMSAL